MSQLHAEIGDVLARAKRPLLPDEILPKVNATKHASRITQALTAMAEKGLAVESIKGLGWHRPGVDVEEPANQNRGAPKLIKSDDKPGGISYIASTVLDVLNDRPRSRTELMQITGRSKSAIGRATKELCDAGMAEAVRPEHDERSVLYESSQWQIEQGVGDGEPLPPAAIADHPDNDCDSGAAMAASNDPEKPEGSPGHADLARKFLSLAGMNIDELERASYGAIKPLPEQDERVAALRRLVPLVSDDIGAALTDVLDRVTGKEAA